MAQRVNSCGSFEDTKACAENPQLSALKCWDLVSADENVEVVIASDNFLADKKNPDGITVQALGSQMALRGAAKEINAEFNRGDNSISQTFVPNTDSIRLALRLFTWEHRGDDSLIIDVRYGETHYPIKFQGGVPYPLTCAQGGDYSLSCIVSVAKRGELGDTAKDSPDNDKWNWLDVDLREVPSGEEVTITYTVVGGENESHTTWAYFDADSPTIANADTNWAQEGSDEYPRIDAEGNVRLGATHTAAPDGDSTFADVADSDPDGDLTVTKIGASEVGESGTSVIDYVVRHYVLVVFVIHTTSPHLRVQAF